MFDFVTWLKSGLEKPGKTQKGLAETLGIAHPQITQMIKGGRRTKVDELGKIAEYLELDYPLAATLSEQRGLDIDDVTAAIESTLSILIDRELLILKHTVTAEEITDIIVGKILRSTKDSKTK